MPVELGTLDDVVAREAVLVEDELPKVEALEVVGLEDEGVYMLL